MNPPLEKSHEEQILVLKPPNKEKCKAVQDLPLKIKLKFALSSELELYA